jgi:phenylacetate-coenzyme A ligase PaaK-like adenylate-forming protein
MFVLDLLRAHRELQAVQRQSRAELEALQRSKFRRLVAHCAAQSDYYRQVMADHRIDPAKAAVDEFPVLEKTGVIEHFDRITTDPQVRRARIVDFVAARSDPNDMLDERFHVINTSGTSGQMGFFVFSDEDWARGVSPALGMNPYRGRRRRLAFYAMTRGHHAGVSMALTSRRQVLRLAYDTRAFDVLMPVEQAVQEIGRFQPEIVVGYPGAIGALADAQRSGRIAIAPAFVQCSGEVVFAPQREAIEQAFGRPLLNVYSSAEHLIMGMSPGGGRPMTLYENNFIFEIRDDHVLVTNLYNLTMPLIRYRLNDRLVPAEEPAADGSPLRRIKEIVGRSDGGDLVFRTSSGTEERISSFAFGSFFPKYVERFQFRISDAACRLDIIPEPGLTPERRREAVADSRARLEQLFAMRGLGHIAVEVRIVEAIAPDSKTGKVRAVIKQAA